MESKGHTVGSANGARCGAGVGAKPGLLADVGPGFEAAAPIDSMQETSARSVARGPGEGQRPPARDSLGEKPLDLVLGTTLPEGWKELTADGSFRVTAWVQAAADPSVEAHFEMQVVVLPEPAVEDPGRVLLSVGEQREVEVEARAPSGLRMATHVTLTLAAQPLELPEVSPATASEVSNFKSRECPSCLMG